MKILFIIAGIVLLLSGLLLSLAICIYAVKEQDEEGFQFLIASASILLLGITLLVRGINRGNAV